MAMQVFDMWRYGQSAYVPSVAQMQLLYAAKEFVNPYIKACGGDLLPDEADGCWYWTSTEVEGQETAQGLALLDGQRCHAGNAQAAGA